MPISNTRSSAEDNRQALTDEARGVNKSKNSKIVEKNATSLDIGAKANTGNQITGNKGGTIIVNDVQAISALTDKAIGAVTGTVDKTLAAQSATQQNVLAALKDISETKLTGGANKLSTGIIVLAGLGVIAFGLYSYA